MAKFAFQAGQRISIENVLYDLDRMLPDRTWQMENVATREYSKRALEELHELYRKGLLTLFPNLVASDTVLTRTSSLAAVLNAVVSGRLHPVGRTHRHNGLPGYVFRLRDVLSIRHTRDAGVASEYLSASDIARLGIMPNNKVAALVRAGIVTSLRTDLWPGKQNLLVPVSELDSFCAKFVSPEALARRLGMTTKSLLDRLRERKVHFLSVPTSQGRGDGLFVPREAAESFAASCVGHKGASESEFTLEDAA